MRNRTIEIIDLLDLDKLSMEFFRVSRRLLTLGFPRSVDDRLQRFYQRFIIVRTGIIKQLNNPGVRQTLNFRDANQRGYGALVLNLPGQPLEPRSEEHTSELQSRRDLVCRLLLEKKKK